MLTLLIFQDLTDSNREAAWEHTGSMGPCSLQSGSNKSPQWHCLWFVRNYSRKISHQEFCLTLADMCLYSLHPVLMWPSLHSVLAPVSVILWGHCTFPASPTSWKPQQSIRLFWSASLLNAICSKGISLFWLIICWWIIEISITFSSQDSMVEIFQTFNMKAFYEKLLGGALPLPGRAVAAGPGTGV